MMRFITIFSRSGARQRDGGYANADPGAARAPVNSLAHARRAGIAFALAAGMLAPMLDASQFQALSDIRQAARTFATKQLAKRFKSFDVEIGAIDARLRLAHCDAPLDGFLPSGSRLGGNSTIGIRCPGTRPWTLYVTARIHVYSTVVVTARPVAKGVVLQAADLRLEKRDLSRIIGTPFVTARQARGRKTKRALRLGVMLTDRALEANHLVRRGQKIVILAQSASVQVRAAGEALANGLEGDLIKVRNLLTHKVIYATIRAPGVVQVPL